ncbi:MAG: reverse transcriptase-like protein [Candidatus Bipolaricaulaceae bacterium]
MRKLFLSAGGAARGEPAVAAIGVVLTDPQGRVLERLGKCIGRANAEVAEYRAILEGLRLALQRQPEELVLFSDNHQVVNQLCGALSPRDPAVQHLNKLAQELLRRFPRARVSYVDPEANRPARRLAELALHEERRHERERQLLRQEILALLEELSLEDLRRVHGFLLSFQRERADAHRPSAGA